MKIGVIGSNSINDILLTFSNIDKYIKSVTSTTPPVILGGGGKGVAQFTKEYCEEYNLNFVEFQPYSFLDKSVDFSNKYFFIRTKQIVDNSDRLLFITNGDCKEVNYGIKYCQKINKPYFVAVIPKK
jgi:hypothetical protein